MLNNLSSPDTSRILPPTNSKYDRVWRALALSRDAVLIGSSYGVLKLLKHGFGGWEQLRLEGHADSIFALDYSPEGWLASGDYRGNILTWTRERESFKPHQRLRLDSYVSGLSFLGSDLLGAMGESGQITLFNFQSQSNEWLPVFQTDAATGAGQSAMPSSDGKQLLAATADEIIGVDPESQQVSRASVKGTIAVFPQKDRFLLLSSSGLRSMKAESLTPLLDLVRYNYVKVALLGHTGFGKSTLCSTLTTGDPGKQLSTFGRRIWTLVTKSDSPQHRILLNDNGGQERVVTSLLPLMADSDLALYFFKQNDRQGFTTALDLQNRLQPRLTSKAKQVLVETYTDQPVHDITEGHILEKIAERKLQGLIKVDPRDPTQVARFRNDLEGLIDWGHSHTAAQSELVDRVVAAIKTLKKKEQPTTTVEELRNLARESLGPPIYLNHLRFLLQNLSDSGEIEYDPSIDKELVILDDPVFNVLRTKIPVYVGEHRGIVSLAEIHKEFTPHATFVAMLDRFYTSTGIAIESNDGTGRIFPPYLDDRPVDIEPFRTLFDADLLEVELEFRVRDFDLIRLIRALLDLRLDCKDATQTEGLFSWGSRALLYYHVNLVDLALGGRKLRFGYSVGGNDEEARTGLESQLHKLLESLYGTTTSGQPFQKKKRPKHEIDVALTYAKEQIEYVQQVEEELIRSGVRVFFDRDRETELLGEDLIPFLQRVFKDLATFCVMFISKDYVRKLWPSHERRSALARQIEQEEPYILPVRFDDTIVPGLSTSIKYVRAEDNTPSQLSERIREKLRRAKERDA